MNKALILLLGACVLSLPLIFVGSWGLIGFPTLSFQAYSPKDNLIDRYLSSNVSASVHGTVVRADLAPGLEEQLADILKDKDAVSVVRYLKSMGAICGYTARDQERLGAGSEHWRCLYENAINTVAFSVLGLPVGAPPIPVRWLFEPDPAGQRPVMITVFVGEEAHG